MKESSVLCASDKVIASKLFVVNRALGVQINTIFLSMPSLFVLEESSKGHILTFHTFLTLFMCNGVHLFCRVIF